MRRCFSVKAIARGLFAATLAISLIGAQAIDTQAATTGVRVVNFRFMPAKISTSTGTTVKWRNATSGTTHTVTAYSGHWSKDTSLSAGASTSFRFVRRGVYKFYCRLHAHITSTGRCVADAGIPTRMCGTIIVS